MKKETFQEVSGLARKMTEASRMTERREAATRLYRFLCDPGKRHKLALEAPSFKALQSVWELIVNNAMIAARKNTPKTRDMTLQDMTMTFQLIQLCDKRYSDEVYSTASKQPTAPPEFSRYRNVFLLGNKMLREVLNFCLQLLEETTATGTASPFTHPFRVNVGRFSFVFLRSHGRQT